MTKQVNALGVVCEVPPEKSLSDEEWQTVVKHWEAGGRIPLSAAEVRELLNF
jgi:hypothetical protein